MPKLIVKKFTNGIKFTVEGIADKKKQAALIAEIVACVKSPGSEPDVVAAFEAPLPQCPPDQPNC